MPPRQAKRHASTGGDGAAAAAAQRSVRARPRAVHAPPVEPPRWEQTEAGQAVLKKYWAKFKTAKTEQAAEFAGRDGQLETGAVEPDVLSGLTDDSIAKGFEEVVGVRGCDDVHRSV